MKPNFRLWMGSAVLSCAFALASAGCQTFSLTEEQWTKQQQGQAADPATGAAVAVAGTAAYCAATAGALAAHLLK